MAQTAEGCADAELVTALIRWFDVNERPLPWRGASPWGVLVSEYMLQQTPVDRVLPVWQDWMRRWPTPPDLAAAGVGDAIRAWGRLGYPRRARWLHASATVLTDAHGGNVPDDPEALRALPGVGEYTTAAVLAFAFGRRSLVMDTNVRRVVARVVHGEAAAPPHITEAERSRADALWPATHRRSARWSAAVMEFGALVCTAARPACETCPVRRRCAWTLAGQPPAGAPARRQAEYAGSDRQARGRILAVLRESAAPATAADLARAWPDDEQRARAVAGLVADGLVERASPTRYRLPG